MKVRHILLILLVAMIPGCGVVDELNYHDSSVTTTTYDPPGTPVSLGNAKVTFTVQGVPPGSKIRSLRFVAYLPSGTTVLNQGQYANFILEPGVVVALGEAAGANFFFPKFRSAPSVDVEMNKSTGFGNGEFLALYCTVPAGVTDVSGITTTNVEAFTDLYKENPLSVIVIPMSLTLL